MAIGLSIETKLPVRNWFSRLRDFATGGLLGGIFNSKKGDLTSSDNNRRACFTPNDSESSVNFTELNTGQLKLTGGEDDIQAMGESMKALPEGTEVKLNATADSHLDLDMEEKWNKMGEPGRITNAKDELWLMAKINKLNVVDYVPSANFIEKNRELLEHYKIPIPEGRQIGVSQEQQTPKT